MTKEISPTKCLLAFAILYGVSNCEPACTKLLVRCYFTDAFSERRLDKINKSVHNPQLVNLIKAKLFDKGSLLETVFDGKTEVIIEEETLEEESDDTVIPLEDIRTAATSTTVNKKSVVKTFRDFVDVPQMRNLGIELLEDWINSPELSQSIGSFISALVDFAKQNSNAANDASIIDKLLLIQQKAIHQFSEPLSKLFTATPELARYTLAKIIQVEYTSQIKVMTSKYLVPVIKYLGENGIQILASIFAEVIKYEPLGQVSEQFASTSKHLFKLIDNIIDFSDFFKNLINLVSESENIQLCSICFAMQLAVVTMTKQGVINEYQTLVSQSSSQKHVQGLLLSGTSPFTPSRKLISIATTVSVVQSFVTSALKKSESTTKSEDIDQFVKYASLAEFMPQITIDPLDKKMNDFIRFSPKSFPVPLPYETLFELTQLISKESLPTILLPAVVRGIKADELRVSSRDNCLSIPEAQTDSFISLLLSKTAVDSNANIYETSSFWNAILIITIITSICPQTIGKTALQIPVVKLAIEAIIRSKFDFPPSIDPTEHTMISSQASESEHESEETIKKSGMEIKLSQQDEMNLIAFNRRKVYKAPKWFWCKLRSFSDELRMQYLLCSSRDPDFLLCSLPSIKNDANLHWSMKFLLKLLKDDAGLLQVFPSEVLLNIFGFIVSNKPLSRRHQQLDKQNEQHKNTTLPSLTAQPGSESFSMLQHHRKKWTEFRRTFKTPGLNNFVTNFLSTVPQTQTRSKSSLKSSADQCKDEDLQTELGVFLPQLISQIREKLTNPSEKERLMDMLLQKLKSYTSRETYKKILNELFNESDYNATDASHLGFLRYFSRQAESMPDEKRQRLIKTFYEIAKEESDYSAVIKYNDFIEELTQSSMMPTNCLREIMQERKFIFRVMFENDPFAAYCYEKFASYTEHTDDTSFYYSVFSLLSFPLSQSVTTIPGFLKNASKIKGSLFKALNTTFSRCVSFEDWKHCFNGNCTELMKIALTQCGYKLLETFSTEASYSLAGLQTLVQFIEAESTNLSSIINADKISQSPDVSRDAITKSVRNLLIQGNLHGMHCSQYAEQILSQNPDRGQTANVAKSSPINYIFENNDTQLIESSITSHRMLSSTPKKESSFSARTAILNASFSGHQPFSQQKTWQLSPKQTTIPQAISIKNRDQWLQSISYGEQAIKNSSEMEVEDSFNSRAELNPFSEIKSSINRIFDESLEATRKQEINELTTLSNVAYPANAFRAMELLNERISQGNNAALIQECEKELFLLTNFLICNIKAIEQSVKLKMIPELVAYSASDVKKVYENFIKNMCSIIAKNSHQNTLNYWFTLMEHCKLFGESTSISTKDITKDFTLAIQSPLAIEHLVSLWSRTPREAETVFVELALKQFNESQRAQLKVLFAAYFCSPSSKEVINSTRIASSKGFDYFVEYGDFKRIKEIISEEIKSDTTISLLRHIHSFLFHPMLISSNYLFQSTKLEKTLNVVSFDKFQIKKLLDVLLTNFDNLSKTEKSSFLSMILGIIKTIHGPQQRNETIQFLVYWLISQSISVCVIVFKYSHLQTPQ